LGLRSEKLVRTICHLGLREAGQLVSKRNCSAKIGSIMVRETVQPKLVVSWLKKFFMLGCPDASKELDTAKETS